MGLLRTLFWIALFIVSTFAFTVLFEYGPSNFGENAQKEWTALMSYYHKTIDAAPATPKTP